MTSTPTHPNPNLPRLLCLHGGGTSALIFKIQTRRLQYALREKFHFVFVDGPFSSGPGPGVLPVFEECGPYYQWIYPPNPLMGQKRARQVIREAIKADGGRFVGVLGFSQGGRQTAGLLADQQNGEDMGLPQWEFGVCLCASYPPQSLEFTRKQAAGEEWKGERDNHGEIREVDESELINVPAVHVTGMNDPHREKGLRLQKYFGKENTISLEFNVSHHLPGAAGDTTSEKGDTERIRNAILQIWELSQATSGARKSSANGYSNGLTTV